MTTRIKPVAAEPLFSGTFVISEAGLVLGSAGQLNFVGPWAAAELAGGVATVTVPPITGSSTVVNEAGADADVRFEGDTATHLLVLDAGLDAVQIGTTIAGAIADFRAASIIFNEPGNDMDWRAESDNNPFMLQMDGGGDYVAMGTAAGGEIAWFGATGVVFNETGLATMDFRVEGDTLTSLLFVDASADRIGIGTSAPAKLLDVRGVIAFYGIGTVPNYFAQGAGNNMQINSNVDEANVIGDTSKSQWKLILGATLDTFSVRRSPAGVSYTEKTLLTVDGAGNVVVGSAALLTTGTAGFLYIPSCAGAPTGVPTAYAGRIPIIYDSTNDALYAYNGAWLHVHVAA